jgi:voltage-gated potassium channel
MARSAPTRRTLIADRAPAASVGLRRRIHEILEVRAEGDRTARIAEIALIVMIVANVTAIILQSEPALDAAWHHWFRVFEAVSIAVFTAEFGLRVWSSVEDAGGGSKGPIATRLRYARSPMALIDLVAIVPFYLSFLVPVDLRFMRVFRLFLVLKLTRYQASMTLLGAVFRNEAKSIGAALFVLALLLIVLSTLGYLAEHRAQPDAFGSIPDAMYWAIVTMTTVGYGDVVAVTPLGKVLAGIIGLLGVGMVALPAGLLASGFSQQLHERRREFEAAVGRILADGTISAEEGDQLKRLRDELGLTDHQAAEITRLIVRRHGAGATCPHCGRPLETPQDTTRSADPNELS